MLQSFLFPKIYCSIRQETIKRYLTITIYIVGKKNSGEEWIAKGISEYEKRISSCATCETNFLKSNSDLIKSAKSARGVILALDETGLEYSSREFSKLLFDSFEKGGSHVSFVIGGFDGLPNEIKQAYPLISLSKMTWTHQMSRLLLIEQIYRAIEIHKGSSYHKD
jgi:23S rRNA (pseudouridine1915-N3)-methyltransferase